MGTGVGDGAALDEGGGLTIGAVLGVPPDATGCDGGTNDGLPPAATWPGSSEAGDGLPRAVIALMPMPIATAAMTRATMAMRFRRAGRRRRWL